MIYTLPYKTKQFFFALIKISIVVAAFYFIYRKLTSNSSLEFSNFLHFLDENGVISTKTILILFVLTGFNYFFEILKWQILVSPTKRISFKKASEQSLGALTASLFTPNRIGEYGAKAIYYTKDIRKHIMLINLLSNLLQMSVTTILGAIGFSFFISKYPIQLNYSKIWPLLIFTVVMITILIFIIRKNKFSIKGFSLKKIKYFIINYPKKLITYGFGLSLLRYLIFSFQFYYLLTIFEIQTSYLHAITIITSMYFLASIIPSIFIFDVLIKGSVAVYLFSFVGVNSFTILCIVTLMWIFNFVIPSILGSYFVLNFNFPEDDL
ncbi:lysylphosphatidylglycerol synthase domain-containing protein [Mariniflexile litorale]|uniref:Lysylphosphatidylglycerol synthase domain-containing protein n=1 Tax=Mariniflexile litorale TaxID=3045158 RepID=A0AAU7EKF4_9FLAO|nr:lysylphosphatidylglycerol synthase domain-containing protein [Mariniflexile sp. KMM 9835]MDQ8212768.1 lysylphosphatidylglycerol synthase domain-containing protein [Mariniflexile sp. KMM 9835]